MSEREKGKLALARDIAERLVEFDGGPELLSWQQAHRFHKDEPYMGCVFCRDEFVPVSEVERLTRERDELRQALYEDPEKWSFWTLVRIARLILDADYPADVFGGESGEKGPVFVAKLREALIGLLSSESVDVFEGGERCPGCGAEPGDEHDQDAHLETEWRMETGSRDPQGPPVGWRPKHPTEGQGTDG